MQTFLTTSRILPADHEQAILIGRIHINGLGPTLVRVSESGLYDLSHLAGTTSELLEMADPVGTIREYGGARIFDTAAVLANSAFDAHDPALPWFLAPCDLQAIKAAGCQAGVVFNPAAPLHVLDWLIDDIDLVLIMSVNPGFGGQSFIDSALRKVEAARKRIDASGRDIRLEVDGGIKADNIRRVADAGADTFVAGSAIFGQPDYGAVIARMRHELQK